MADDGSPLFSILRKANEDEQKEPPEDYLLYYRYSNGEVQSHRFRLKEVYDSGVAYLFRATQGRVVVLPLSCRDTGAPSGISAALTPIFPEKFGNKVASLIAVLGGDRPISHTFQNWIQKTFWDVLKTEDIHDALTVLRDRAARDRVAAKIDDLSKEQLGLSLQLQFEATDPQSLTAVPVQFAFTALPKDLNRNVVFGLSFQWVPGSSGDAVSLASRQSGLQGTARLEAIEFISRHVSIDELFDHAPEIRHRLGSAIEGKLPAGFGEIRNVTLDIGDLPPDISAEFSNSMPLPDCYLADGKLTFRAEYVVRRESRANYYRNFGIRPFDEWWGLLEAEISQRVRQVLSSTGVLSVISKREDAKNACVALIQPWCEPYGYRFSLAHLHCSIDDTEKTRLSIDIPANQYATAVTNIPVNLACQTTIALSDSRARVLMIQDEAALRNEVRKCIEKSIAEKTSIVLPSAVFDYFDRPWPGHPASFQDDVKEHVEASLRSFGVPTGTHLHLHNLALRDRFNDLKSRSILISKENPQVVFFDGMAFDLTFEYGIKVAAVLETAWGLRDTQVPGPEQIELVVRQKFATIIRRHCFPPSTEKLNISQLTEKLNAELPTMARDELCLEIRIQDLHRHPHVVELAFWQQEVNRLIKDLKRMDQRVEKVADEIEGWYQKKIAAIVKDQETGQRDADNIQSIMSGLELEKSRQEIEYEKLQKLLLDAQTYVRLLAAPKQSGTQ